MTKKLFQNKLIVKKSSLHNSGYGVFAGKTIRKKELIEECYVVISRGGDKVLQDFYFDAKKGKSALFLGFGSIYNHSEEPNADYTINKRKRIATIKAKRTIRKGEEIFLYYGYQWFSSRKWKPKKAKK